MGLFVLIQLTVPVVLLHTTPAVPPVVRVHPTKPTDYGKRSMLQCSVTDFFPLEVRVSWLKDGVEVTSDVSSTDVLANGDWSFQLHAYLELTPRRGERVSCRVDHSSLTESLEVDWDTSSLDAKHLKMAVGIIFFFIGLTVAAGGAAYYWRKQSLNHLSHLYNSA
uniref:beta-2-microglobulin-like n=1 Tax=Epinephelus lanceolatus TaxID=310571 RepID=UPI00144881B7|nr:beta-2-microglobulin-like [Epinephelus lanceolatus]